MRTSSRLNPAWVRPRSGSAPAGGPAGETERLAAPVPKIDLPPSDSAEEAPDETRVVIHLSPDGTIRMEFTIPEALTQWKFMGFAHYRELRAGYLQDSVVTAKDLMVQPNPPRFLREGDVIEFFVVEKIAAETL